MTAPVGTQTPEHAPAGSGPALLVTRRLTKRFGDLVAVDALDLEVREGEVHGFLGPNGSGKSVTVGMIMGLLHPTAGQVELFGEDLHSGGRHLLGRVGAIIENPAFYPYLSGRENLQTIALAAGGVPSGRVEELLEVVHLTERADSPYENYSLGMKQRLGLASTLLTDPQIVILDEPTNGLDPAGQREIRGLIPRLAREGRAVLLASHLLHEVEQVCDRVTILQRGRRVESGLVRDLLQRGSYLDIGIADREAATSIISALPYVERVTPNADGVAVLVDPARGAEITRALAEHGHYPGRIVPHVSTLEEVFLELTDVANATGKVEHDA